MGNVTNVSALSSESSAKHAEASKAQAEPCPSGDCVPNGAYGPPVGVNLPLLQKLSRINLEQARLNFELAELNNQLVNKLAELSGGRPVELSGLVVLKP